MVDEATQSAGEHHHARHACPRCGAPLVKVHRSRRDRLRSVFHSVRRYRCRAQGCGWEGLVDRERDAASLWASARRMPAFWFVAGMLVTLFAVLLVQVYLAVELAQPPPVAAEDWEREPLPVGPGASLAGKALEPDDVRLRAGGPPAGLRRGCVWGGPGQLPYVGTLEEALHAARLPEKIVAKFAAMHAGGLVSDRLEISSAGIRNTTHHRHFGHSAKAMALERSLCFNTRLNFPAGAVANADLYELVDTDGQRFVVMVTTLGGHVALLDEHTER